MSLFNFQEEPTPVAKKKAISRKENASRIESTKRKEKECDCVFHEQVEYLMKKYGSCLNVAETANELKISKDLVYDLLNKGEIHSQKAGDRRVVPTASLIYWLIYGKER